MRSFSHSLPRQRKHQHQFCVEEDDDILSDVPDRDALFDVPDDDEAHETHPDPE